MYPKSAVPACERLFSAAANFVNKTRSLLEANTVNISGVTTPGKLRAVSSWVEFIYTRAVASPENEQDILCLSIRPKPNDAFVLKPKYKFSKTTTASIDNNHSIHYIQYRPGLHLSERVIIMWLCGSSISRPSAL